MTLSCAQSISLGTCVLAQVEELERQLLLNYYRLGQIFAAAERKDKCALVLAKRMRVAKTLLCHCEKISKAWHETQFKKLIMRRNRAGRLLPFTTLRTLAYATFVDRDELTELTLENNWHHKTVRQECLRRKHEKHDPQLVHSLCLAKKRKNRLAGQALRRSRRNGTASNTARESENGSVEQRPVSECAAGDAD